MLTVSKIFTQILILPALLLPGDQKNKALRGTAGKHSVYVSLKDMIYGKYYQGSERRRMKEEKMKVSEC